MHPAQAKGHVLEFEVDQSQRRVTGELVRTGRVCYVGWVTKRSVVVGWRTYVRGIDLAKRLGCSSRAYNLCADPEAILKTVKKYAGRPPRCGNAQQRRLPLIFLFER